MSGYHKHNQLASGDPIMVAALSETRSALPREESVLETLRERIRAATLRPEREAIEELRGALLPLSETLEAARGRAIRWIEAARAGARSRPLAESLLDQFPLDSRQGKALMSLAEALLRTPDHRCADRLIAERLAARGPHNRFQLTPGSSHAEAHFYRQATERLIHAGFDVLRVDCGKRPPEQSAALIRDQLISFFASAARGEGQAR